MVPIDPISLSDELLRKLKSIWWGPQLSLIGACEMGQMMWNTWCRAWMGQTSWIEHSNKPEIKMLKISWWWISTVKLTNIKVTKRCLTFYEQVMKSKDLYYLIGPVVTCVNNKQQHKQSVGQVDQQFQTPLKMQNYTTNLICLLMKPQYERKMLLSPKYSGTIMNTK